MNARRRRPEILMLASLLMSMTGTAHATSPDGLDAAFEKFWQAKPPSRQRSAIRGIVALQPDFDEVYDRIRRGRAYSADVPTGLVYQTRKVPFYYTVLVPEDYDPARRYPVAFYLHGGVARPQWERHGKWWNNYDRVKSPDRIAVFPASWDEAMWWERNQVENVEAILNEVKRRYNVDENRVTMIGISDGGTGAYFFAMRAPTPWASFVPLIGHALVLTNASLGVDGQMYVPNLANRPLFVVNAGKDHLYPSARVRPYIELFRRAGADVRFVDKPEATHGLRWWAEEKARIEAFVKEHPRDPLPDRIVWETELAERYQRCDWLLVTEFGTVAGESDLADMNALGGFLSPRLFPRHKPSGRVELERRGNHVEVKTRGVRRFRLLLSPDEIDFAEPVTVTVNGSQAFRGMVEHDVETLLRWAAEDLDRTALFAAQLDVEVPRQ